MPDCMMPFPEDWHDFLKDYSFDDSQEVYTNGSRLIPVFRVEQLIEHLLKVQKPAEPVPAIDDVGDWLCGNCYQSVVGTEELDASGFVPVKFNFCPNCGREVKWK